MQQQQLFPISSSSTIDECTTATEDIKRSSPVGCQTIKENPPSSSFNARDDHNDNIVDVNMNIGLSAAVTAAAQPTAMAPPLKGMERCPWRVGVCFHDHSATETAGDESKQMTSHPEKKKSDTDSIEVTDRGTRLGMEVNEGERGPSPMPPQTTSSTSTPPTDVKIDPFQSLLEPDLFDDQAAQRVEPALATSCEALGFDIAEMWLRTGARSHQLIASYLRPTALDETLRSELTEVYYGVDASSRTHRFSPALCKKAKEVGHVFWVPDDTEHGVQALSCSLNNVKTAVAVPVTHESSNTNFTVIYFCMRQTKKSPFAIEFLMHMALATAIAAVNVNLNQDPKNIIDPSHRPRLPFSMPHHHDHSTGEGIDPMSQSEHNDPRLILPHHAAPPIPDTAPLEAPPPKLNFNIDYETLLNREYLTDGTNNWIHTAVMNKLPVVVKELKPECEDDVRATNEIEEELAIHSKLRHPHICAVHGAGITKKGSRFIVLERLDGGMLAQVFGYRARIRDRRKRFARRKKKMSSMDALNCALAIAEALDFCHGRAIPGCMVIHRDLKPDNIGFALDGTVKIIDFGLATIVKNASPDSDEVYNLSGETGSLRYMAPEVADARPYNQKADVYSFGMILWELLSYEKPFDGMDRQQFYERVVHGGERPPISRRFPMKWTQLISQCWSSDSEQRPSFNNIAETLKEMVEVEASKSHKSLFSKFTDRHNKGREHDDKKKLTERHSTWF